jgi:hypothetical protein
MHYLVLVLKFRLSDLKLQVCFSLVGLSGSFPNETQIKLHISSIEYSSMINAWAAELAYYARHGVSSQRRVQDPLNFGFGPQLKFLLAGSS